MTDRELRERLGHNGHECRVEDETSSEEIIDLVSRLNGYVPRGAVTVEECIASHFGADEAGITNEYGVWVHKGNDERWLTDAEIRECAAAILDDMSGIVDTISVGKRH